MAANREKDLLAGLGKVSVATAGYRFHWTVANGIPPTYDHIQMIVDIGISWLDHKLEYWTGAYLYNDVEDSAWYGVSDREECAQAVACRVTFIGANISLTDDVLKANEGECLVNASWTIALKSAALKKSPKGGPIPLSDLFELRRN